MAVSSTCTFLQSPPLRPGESDVIDGVKSNATPTVPPHMPNASEFMQMARLIVAMAGVVPVAVFTVTFSGGTPSIAGFKTVRSDMVLGDFTVVDNGAGDTTIKWTAGKFPASSIRPSVSFAHTSSVSTYNITAAQFSGGGFEGVRVIATADGGSGADLPFTVLVY